MKGAKVSYIINQLNFCHFYRGSNKYIFPIPILTLAQGNLLMSTDNITVRSWGI